MKKTYKLQGLDCANCARKMEDGIRKIEGVDEVQVNFLAQKLSLSASDALFEGILEKAIKVCRRVDPDCELLR